jgi:hypothetical protein
VKENGEVAVEGGFKDPAPFSIRVTLEALPPKVFPLTVIAVVPHMLPYREVWTCCNTSVGIAYGYVM